MCAVLWYDDRLCMCVCFIVSCYNVISRLRLFSAKKCANIKPHQLIQSSPDYHSII